jgi:hypothetical protein
LLPTLLLLLLLLFLLLASSFTLLLLLLLRPALQYHALQSIQPTSSCRSIQHIPCPRHSTQR